MPDWAADDYVGTAAWTLSYWDAWSFAAPTYAGGYGKTFVIDGGGAGEYQIHLCLYPENATASNLQANCGSNPSVNFTIASGQ